MNALVLEDGDDALLIDCGVMFPDEEVGIDVMHADFSYAVGLGDRLKAVVITHGHEDHIGAVPFLLSEIRVPVYAPPFALTLLASRLAESGLGFDPDLRPTTPRAPFAVGSLQVEPIRVTHSIPDATALAISTSAGTIIHSGDFKVDLNPPDGRHFDLQRLSELGAAGVTLLLSDSTNIEMEGISRGEKDVAGALDRTIGEAGDARVFVSLFSTNLLRLQAVVDAAARHGRRVALVGRSVTRNAEAGVRTGLLRLDPSALLPAEKVREHPRGRTLVVAAGTQGEPRSVLTRVALGEHRHLAVESGDLVILTSRHIPGNELAIARVIDNLARLGARVVHVGNRPEIHGSGHAYREEQKLMIQLVRPRFFIPVHGTYQYLAYHARLAAELGVEAPLLLENGQVAELERDGLRRAGSVPVERIHRDRVSDVSVEVLGERRALADVGLISVFIVLDRDFRLLADPQVSCCGVLSDEEIAPVQAGAARALREEIESAPEGDRHEPARLRDRCRRTVRRFFDRSIGRRPMALVNLSIVAGGRPVSLSPPRRDSCEMPVARDDPSLVLDEGSRK
jgi:ribonuclease J